MQKLIFMNKNKNILLNILETPPQAMVELETAIKKINNFAKKHLK